MYMHILIFLEKLCGYTGFRSFKYFSILEFPLKHDMLGISQKNTIEIIHRLNFANGSVFLNTYLYSVLVGSSIISNYLFNQILFLNFKYSSYRLIFF